MSLAGKGPGRVEDGSETGLDGHRTVEPRPGTEKSPPG